MLLAKIQTFLFAKLDLIDQRYSLIKNTDDSLSIKRKSYTSVSQREKSDLTEKIDQFLKHLGLAEVTEHRNIIELQEGIDHHLTFIFSKTASDLITESISKAYGVVTKLGLAETADKKVTNSITMLAFDTGPFGLIRNPDGTYPSFEKVRDKKKEIEEENPKAKNKRIQKQIRERRKAAQQGTITGNSIFDPTINHPASLTNSKIKEKELIDKHPVYRSS